MADVLAALDIKFSGDEPALTHPSSTHPVSASCRGPWPARVTRPPIEPHRRSHIVKLPEVLEVVTEEQLEALAASGAAGGSITRGNGSGRFDVKAFLDRHSIAVRREKPGRGPDHLRTECLPLQCRAQPGEAFVQ